MKVGAERPATPNLPVRTESTGPEEAESRPGKKSPNEGTKCRDPASNSARHRELHLFVSDAAISCSKHSATSPVVLPDTGTRPSVATPAHAEPEH